MNDAEKNKPIVFGFWLYLMSDCLLFAALFATFAVLRGNTFGGPNAEDLLNLPFVLAETLILLISSFAMGMALLSATASKTRATVLWLSLTFLLGVSFLVLEVHEFAGLIAAGNGPSTSGFLSAFFALVGTHGLHVAGGLLWMLLIGAHLWRKGITEENLRRLTLAALFWHFLDVIWVCIFSIVYLLGATL
ncbi:MAG: cytochrome o ubiquinol oxidase subunit III [Chthoniobacterales bacterium]